MKHYSDMIGRFGAAWFDTWAVSLTIAETMAASQTVIGARMAMLGVGLENPGRFPFVEFSRLLPEKAAAFGKAQAGAARAIGKVTTGLPDETSLLDWWEGSIRATAGWWAPIHAQVVANARRLS